MPVDTPDEPRVAVVLRCTGLTRDQAAPAPRRRARCRCAPQPPSCAPSWRPDRDRSRASVAPPRTATGLRSAVAARMACGVTTCPPLKNVAYAAVISSSPTSPVPNASDGRSGSFSDTRAGERRQPPRPGRHLHFQPHRGRIQALRERLLQRHFAAPARFEIHRAPFADVQRRIEHQVVRPPPCSSAASHTNGLNADPGCRRACVARL